MSLPVPVSRFFGAACLPVFVRPLRLPLGVLCLGLCALANAGLAHADQNTELRLNQGLEQNAQEREQRLLEEEGETTGELPELIVDGEAYAVEGDVNAMGRALYIALQQKQWPAAAKLLAAYRTLDGADPMLVHYAQGKLARLQGDLGKAEAEFRALLGLQPDFILGRLELARVLFERHDNREATRRFDAIRDTLAADPRDTAGVRNTVDVFLKALAERRSWQGKIALGPSYDDNLNRSSESYSCLLYTVTGNCFISRSVPEAIAAYGLDYEASARKHFFFGDGHGAYLRGLAYGNVYDDHAEYNEHTLSASAGYRYRGDINTFSIGPEYEQRFFGTEGLYGAWGVAAEWMHEFSRTTALRLEGDYKKLTYRDPRYARFDGPLASVYATLFHRLTPHWTVFGGIDGLDKSGGEEFFTYEQGGLRLGVSRDFDFGLNATLFASLRRKQYDVFNPLIGERRRDDEQNYTLILKAPRLAWQGVIPTLSLEHTRVHSNVDWLYSYERNAASLKMEYPF